MDEHRVGGCEISYLTCLALGGFLNLTSDDMLVLRCHGIAVDDDNDPDPENIIDQDIQPVNALNWDKK